jgi:hypothetical protein
MSQYSPRTSEGYWKQMGYALSSFTNLEPVEIVEKVRLYVAIEAYAGSVSELFIKRYFNGACSCLDDDGRVLANACWPWLPDGFVVWLFRYEGGMRERYYKPVESPRKEYPRQIELIASSLAQVVVVVY